MAVYNFGSINIDHVYGVAEFVSPGETLSSTSYQAILGGKGANQSIACAHAGIKTFHIGAIHRSNESMLAPMVEANVDTRYVALKDDIASGHAIIQVNCQGENAIILYPGANHCLSLSTINEVLAEASSQDWVLVQNETNNVAAIVDAAFNANIPLAFNPAPMTASAKELPLEKISLLIVNEVEAMQLTNTINIETAKAALLDLSRHTKVLLTMGKQGVYFLSALSETFIPAFTVNAIDSTAAGDTFIGYFLAHFVQQDQLEHALNMACAASAISVTREGAAQSIPVLEEVETFLREHS